MIKSGSVFSPPLAVSSCDGGDCFMFSPPHPVKKFFYRCDRKFYLEDLMLLYENHDNYAIVLVSGKRSEFYLHNCNQTKFLKKIEVDLPNQHKTGGYSAPRFGRIRDSKINLYVKKMAETMTQLYVKNNIFQSKKGLILAGPAQMKDLLQLDALFVQHFAKHLVKSLTIKEITDQSIYQVIQLSSTDIPKMVETDLVTKFDAKLTDPSQMDTIVFGIVEVLDALRTGQLKEIYVADSSEHKESITNMCTSLKTKIIMIKSKEFSLKYGELVGIRYYAECEIIEV